MRPARAILYTLVLALLMPLMGTDASAAEAESSPRPDAGSGSTPSLWLSGPFGRVLGGDPAAPAGAAPDGRPLDTWMRAAPLVVEADVAVDPEGLSVTSWPLDRAGATEQLSHGAMAFAGPAVSGRHVIVASVETDADGLSQFAWLVDVPDRAGSDEALLEMPGPTARLASAAGSVDGEPGHGCYVYFCAEAGYRPPLGTLEVLPLAVGETPTLGLDDGSAMVGWTGTLEPVGQTRSERIHGSGSFPDEPQAVPLLHGLEPTVAGEWLLELRADLDRERGWQWFLYRLVVE